MKTIKTILALGFLAISFSSTTHASCGSEKTGCENKKGGSFYFLDYAETLKLSDAQVAKLNKIRLNSEKDAKQLALKLDLAKDDLIKVSHDPSSDRKKIENAIEAVSKAEKEMLKAEAFSILDARDTLTSSQLKTMRDMSISKDKGCCHGESPESKKE